MVEIRAITRVNSENNKKEVKKYIVHKIDHNNVDINQKILNGSYLDEIA